MDDSETYSGCEAFNKCLIRNILINPVLSDLLKQRVMQYEFKMIKNKPELEYYFAIATQRLLSAFHNAEKTQKTAYFAGYLGLPDHDQLMGMFQNQNIIFPGWIEGWFDKSEALKYLDALDDEREKENSSAVQRVLIEINDA